MKQQIIFKMAGNTFLKMNNGNDLSIGAPSSALGAIFETVLY